jgi:hypothetical protein
MCRYHTIKYNIIICCCRTVVEPEKQQLRNIAKEWYVQGPGRYPWYGQVAPHQENVIYYGTLQTTTEHYVVLCSKIQPTDAPGSLL